MRMAIDVLAGLGEGILLVAWSICGIALLPVFYLNDWLRSRELKRGCGRLDL